MIMEAMLILTLVSPAMNSLHPRVMSTTSQMLPTMEACHRTKDRLEALHNRRDGAVREFIATVVCVDAR